MLKIRLSMGGVRKRPIYKIVIADSRFPRDGRFIEKVGLFNPLLPKEKKERITIEAERVKHWISKGAKPITTSLSKIEKKISKIIAKDLKKEKIFFAGIDFIDQKLNGDINVTSPTGLKTFYDLSKKNLAKTFWRELKV